MKTIEIIKKRFSIANLNGMDKVPVNQGDVIKFKQAFRGMNAHTTMKIIGTTILLIVNGHKKYRVTKYKDPKRFILQHDVRLKHRKYRRELIEVNAGTMLTMVERGRYNTRGFLIDVKGKEVFFPAFCFYDEENEGFNAAFRALERYKIRPSNYKHPNHE